LADATSNHPNIGLVSSSVLILVSVMLRLTAIAVLKYAALTAITARPLGHADDNRVSFMDAA
jgi:hypothetical protein